MSRELRGRFVCCATSVVVAAVGITGGGCGGRPGGPAADTPAAPVVAPVVVPPAPPTLAGGRLVATATGALVIDADSGQLVAVDASGRATSRLAVAHGAGLMAYDPARALAFVADRRGDRVVVIDVDAMEERASWPTPVEPFGVALTPDRATVLVTTIADRTLVAFDAQTGVQQWRAALSAEPRGIAVSPDGSRALVSSIATGAVDHVVLAPPYRVTAIPYRLDCELCRAGETFARGSGGVMFLDARRAVASFQREVPVSNFATASHYGGRAFLPPVSHHLAFLAFDAGNPDVVPTPTQTVAQIPNHQPRSLAWDAGGDALFVAGLGTDTFLYMPGLTRGAVGDVEASASTATLQAADRCGPDGIVVTAARDVLLWCSFTRTVMRVTNIGPVGFLPETRIVEGPWLASSSMPPLAHEGMVLFNKNAPELNIDGALACATCHPDGRSDGLAWRIGAREHQTPVLAGRVVDTAPYKWDGSDASLSESLATTVRRMNGRGLSMDQTRALVAFLEAMPPPRVPTRDAATVARGAALFEEAGCSECHAGARLTDRTAHAIPGNVAPFDTPSLVGLFASAPYYHDGSAETLDDLLRGYGIGREMADLATLSLPQRADLKAFLETR